MRIRYSTIDPAQDEYDSLPRLTLMLRLNGRAVEAIGLIDSGATVNVMPFSVGLRLGAVWDVRKANLRLAGNLGDRDAMPLFVTAQMGELAPVRLAFAWVDRDDVPLILGQTNFFMEFEICFYRSRLEFEVNPRSA